MRFPGVRVVSCAVLLAATGTALASDRPLKSIGGKLAVRPPGDSGLLFIVGGDNRPTGKGAPIPRMVKTVFEEIGLIRPDLVVWTGDTVYGYGDSAGELSREYDQFQALAQKAGVPLFNAPGNHEIHRADDASCSAPRGPAPLDSETQFLRRFGNLYGSFDAGPAHFIALNTAVFCREDSVDGEQMEWLKGDLEAHKNASAIFIFCHTEFFSSPQIDEPAGKSHPPIQNRGELQELFRKYPVKAVFSGHEHLFWRESHDGIDYFVAGGAGAPLYASPERGGFSHYILVSLTEAGIRYDVLEPGHLYVEPRSAAPGKKSVWIVNSNDVDVPLRGVSIEVPRPGPCSALRAVSELRRWDGTPVPVPVSKLSCLGAKGGSRVALGLIAPRGSSVPVVVRAGPP